MATLTVFGDASDGGISSQSTVYADAREGTGTAVLVADSTDVDLLNGVSGMNGIGQTDNSNVNECTEGFVAFDTSPLGGGASISAAVLSLWDSGSAPSTAFTVEVRSRAWGPTLTTGDFVAGSALSGLTLLAHLASASRAAGAYNAFVDDAMAIGVNQTGFTRMLLNGSLHRLGTEPALDTSDALQYSAADEVGTTQDPKLVITYTAATGPRPARGSSG